jgi:hypothetical protein
MSSFDEREKEFEARYKHDQEFAFKARVRRNRLLGRWAAQHLGLSGADADKYAGEVVGADFGKHGDEAVVKKIAADFAAKSVDIAAPRIADELQRCAAEAKQQLMKE